MTRDDAGGGVRRHPTWQRHHQIVAVVLLIVALAGCTGGFGGHANGSMAVDRS